jgi:hypothetical protein
MTLANKRIVGLIRTSSASSMNMEVRIVFQILVRKRDVVLVRYVLFAMMVLLDVFPQHVNTMVRLTTMVNLSPAMMGVTTVIAMMVM